MTGTWAPATRDAYRDAARDAARLNRLFAVLGEPAPVAAVLDRAVLALSELFGADVVALLRPAPGGILAPVAAIGLPEAAAGRPFSAAESGHAAAALRSRAPVLVPEARFDPALEPRLRDLEVEAVAWLPVLGAGEEAALLVLARCQAIPFARADVDLIMAMAHRIGLLLERARAEASRRDLEERLRQAEKAESLGRMAAAIAHHFNNKLAAVIGSLEVARTTLPEGHAALQELLEAQDAARQAARVSGLMLTYLGQGAAGREPIDLGAACRDALPALVAMAGAAAPAVQVRTSWPEEPILVCAHAASVRQVLGNLLANALEALPAGGGEVAVSLRAVDAAEVSPAPFLWPSWVPVAERYACLEVADGGAGVAAGDLAKVFDPFFTTKFPGRGLGLPVVLGVVRAHGGALAVRSAPGKGSAFRVWLPLTAAEPERPAQAAPPEPAAGEGGVALVVDDEPIIRRATARLLRQLGYEVEVAVDGVEAVEAVRRRATEVRLVVLDVTMPRMGGWEALAAIRALRPGVPVVLASGYDEARVMSGDHPERPQAFLQKPFDLPELEAAVARALGRA